MFTFLDLDFDEIDFLKKTKLNCTKVRYIINFFNQNKNLMKKMNLSFSGLKIKMMLSLFLLMGLFFISTNEVSAQSSSSKEYAEIVSAHAQKLSLDVSITMPVMKSSKEVINNPKVASELNVAVEKTFGEEIVTQIIDNGFEAKDAIEKAYQLLNAKVPVKYLDPVKEVYLGML